MNGSPPPVLASARPAADPAAPRRLVRTVARLRTLALLASGAAVLALAGAFLTYQRFSTLRPIVVVGGQAITRRDYEEALEQRDGKVVLNELVSAALVRQAAARAGVSPTEGEVAARLALVRQRDPALIRQAQADGTLPSLRSQLFSQIALENLRLQNVSVSEAEVAHFYAAHQSSFQQSAQARLNLIAADTPEQAAAAASDLHDGIALDVIAEQGGLHVAGMAGYRVDLATPQGRALARSWKTMRAGEIRTSPWGQGVLIAQMVSTQPAGTVPLADVRADVTRLARLEKAVPADVEMVRLYRSSPPSFPVEKYAAFLGADAQAGR